MTSNISFSRSDRIAARDAGKGERSALPLNVTAALRARECTRGSVDSDTEQMMCTSCPTRVKYDSRERTYCCTPSGLSMLSSRTSAIFIESGSLRVRVQALEHEVYEREVDDQRAKADERQVRALAPCPALRGARVQVRRVDDPDDEA